MIYSTSPRGAGYSKALWEEATQADLHNIDLCLAEIHDLRSNMAKDQVIAGLIDLFAEMFQATVPSENALSVWFRIFREYPEYLVKAGGRHLMKTYKWPRLPLPADLITAIEQCPERSELDSEELVYQLLGTAIRRAERYMNQSVREP